MSISTFLDTQGFFQEAKMHGRLLRNHMSVKKWPILDIRTGQLSKRDLEKPQHGMFSVCDTLARTGSVNSSYCEPQVVCHLLSCCVHTSITSESESKVFEMSDKL